MTKTRITRVTKYTQKYRKLSLVHILASTRSHESGPIIQYIFHAKGDLSSDMRFHVRHHLCSATIQGIHPAQVDLGTQLTVRDLGCIPYVLVLKGSKQAHGCSCFYRSPPPSSISHYSWEPRTSINVVRIVNKRISRNIYSSVSSAECEPSSAQL